MPINPIIIPTKDVVVGDILEHEGQQFVVDAHFSQGKDMKDKGYSYIMFSNKGAFGLVSA